MSVEQAVDIRCLTCGGRVERRASGRWFHLEERDWLSPVAHAVVLPG